METSFLEMLVSSELESNLSLGSSEDLSDSPMADSIPSSRPYLETPWVSSPAHSARDPVLSTFSTSSEADSGGSPYGTIYPAFSTILYSKQEICIYNGRPFTGESSEATRLWAVDAWFYSEREKRCFTYKRFCCADPSFAFYAFISPPMRPTWRPTLREINSQSFYEMIQSNRPTRIYFDIDLDVKDYLAEKMTFEHANWFTGIFYACVEKWIRSILPINMLASWQASITTDGDYSSGFQIVESCSNRKLSYHVVTSNIQILNALQAKCAAMHFTTFLSNYIEGALLNLVSPETCVVQQDILSAAAAAAAAGKLVDLSVYSDLRQMRTLGSPKIKAHEKRCTYERKAHLCTNAGALIGDDWNSRPLGFVGNTGMDMMDVWNSALCIPLCPVEFKVFFDPNPLMEFPQVRLYKECGIPAMPDDYVLARSKLHPELVPDSWRATAPMSRGRSMGAAHCAPGTVSELDVTPSGVDEPAGQSLYTINGIGGRPDPKVDILFMDADEYVVAGDMKHVMCKSLKKGWSVFCPGCETLFYSDRYSFKIPKAIVGTPSAKVVDGLRPAELSIKCFNEAECGKYTAIVQSVCHRAEFVDHEMNVAEVHKIDLNTIDTITTGPRTGFLSIGRFDGRSVLFPENRPASTTPKLLVMSAPVGAGKSTCVIDIIRRTPRAKCLVICHRRMLSSTLSHIHTFGRFNERGHTELRYYRDLKDDSKDEEYEQLSICVNSIHKIFKNGAPRVKYDFVVIDECYSALEHLTGDTFRHEDAIRALVCLGRLCKEAGKVIAMQQEVPPIAVDVLQKICHVTSDQTYVARVINPVSVMPALLVEAPTAIFDTVGMQFMMTMISQMYWDAVIHHKKKLYIPTSTKKQAFLMAIAIWSALLRWKATSLITEEIYTMSARRIKVAVHVPDVPSMYKHERQWLANFNHDPEKNSEDVDVLISTSVIQSGHSLPADFVYMAAIMSRAPMTHRHQIQSISRLKTNNRQLGNQRALILVERGSTGGRDVLPLPAGTELKLTDEPERILALLAFLGDSERADTSNRNHWLLRQFYGSRSHLLSMVPENGQSVFILSNRFLQEAGKVDDIPCEQVALAQVEVYGELAAAMKNRTMVDPRFHYLFPFDERYIVVSEADTTNGLTQRFPVFETTGIAPLNWLRDAKATVRATSRLYYKRDIGLFFTATPFACCTPKSQHFSTDLQLDSVRLALIILLHYRKQANYPIGRTTEERQQLVLANKLATLEWSKTTQLHQGEGDLNGVMPTANLLADIVIELGLIDRAASGSPAFVFEGRNMTRVTAFESFRLEPEVAIFQRLLADDERRRYSSEQFFRWYLIAGHPCWVHGTEKEREEFAHDRKLAIRHISSENETSVNTWWLRYKEPKKNKKRNASQMAGSPQEDAEDPAPLSNNQSRISTSELAPRLEVWGESVRRLLARIVDVKIIMKDEMWRVNGSPWIYTTATMLARSPDKFSALSNHMSKDLFHSVVAAAVLSPLLCGIKLDGEAARNGFDVRMMRVKSWRTVINATWLAVFYKAHRDNPLMQSWNDCSVSSSLLRQAYELDGSSLSAMADTLSDVLETTNRLLLRLRRLEIVDFKTLPEYDTFFAAI